VIALEDAQRRVLDACARLAAVAVPLSAARGLVLADAVTAAEPVPPFANTAMDGFAVRAADTAGAPVELRVVATLAAGAAPTVAVGPGEAVRIMTGAPIPDGADAIVMVESTAPSGADHVRIEAVATAGDHIRPAGDDVQPGDVVIGAGVAVTPAHLGVLASVGATTVTVYPRVAVGVLSTGDELVQGGGPLRPGQIRDSNRPSLLALLEESGAVAVDLGPVADDEAALTAALTDGATRCDAILTTGGVSMGDFDYVKVVLDRLSDDMTWMQVAIKPAKPFAFGTIAAGARRVPVFGLPGNPVSSLVSYELFARPALRQMMGHPELGRPRVLAIADDGLRRRPDGRVHFVRVAAHFGPDGRCHARSSGGQGSHQLAAMAAANALVVLPDGDGVTAGGEVDAILLGSLV
jgi:molybdenum cofactor synthesis domain-containing protein